MREPRRSQWQSRLRTHHLRITRPRKMIMEFLSGTRKPVSAEEIYMKVHKAHPALGFATVYRTLDLLESLGIVSKLQFGDARNRYELEEGLAQRGHHHHLVCTKCRNVIDYDDFVDEERELITKVERELTRKHRFHIMGHAIHFYGECGRCSASIRSSASKSSRREASS